MFLVVVAVLVLGAWIAVARPAERGSTGARVTLVLGSIALTLTSAATFLLALIALALTCDESCDDRSTRWQDNPDAWQWTAQAVVALGGLLAVIVALVLVLLRRYRAATVSVAVAAACFAVWGAGLSIFI